MLKFTENLKFPVVAMRLVPFTVFSGLVRSEIKILLSTFFQFNLSDILLHLTGDKFVITTCHWQEIILRNGNELYRLTAIFWFVVSAYDIIWLYSSSAQFTCNSENDSVRRTYKIYVYLMKNMLKNTHIYWVNGSYQMIS